MDQADRLNNLRLNKKPIRGDGKMNRILNNLPILPYLELIKYRGRAVIFPWGAFIGAVVASGGIPPLLPTVTAIIVMYLVALFAYVYNDVQDMDADIINSGDRPLPSGKVSKRQAMKLAVASAALALTIALLLDIKVLGLTCFGVLLGYIYSTPPLSLKNQFFLKQTTASLWAAISSLGGGIAASGEITGTTLYAGILFFVYGMAFSPVADIGDIAGDQAVGKRTVAVVLGPAFTVKMGSAVILLFAAVTALAYSIFGFNLACPILVTVLSLVAVLTVWPLVNRWEDPYSNKRVVKKLILLHFLIQASLVAGVL